MKENNDLDINVDKDEFMKLENAKNGFGRLEFLDGLI